MEYISSNPLWPNLAGQKDGYLAKQMKAFRDGTRNDPMMSPMAKPLSDADIDNIAAYYSWPAGAGFSPAPFLPGPFSGSQTRLPLTTAARPLLTMYQASPGVITSSPVFPG